MSLSVALAVHNEEKNITRCLLSVYDWADEVIIVDGQSTDKTVEIIKSLDTKGIVKIFTEPNVAMFHKNKQKALEKCTSEWILQLDADEVVSEKLKEEILSVISNTSPVISNEVRDPREISHPTNAGVRNDDIIAYWIPRLNYFLDKPLRKGGQYPDYTIRLYKNGVAKFPCKSVHEQVEISDGNHVEYLKSDLLHYPYPSFESYLEKWVRYAILEGQMLYDKGIKPTAVNHIKYFILYPKLWFFKTYIRHKGFADGIPGFVFSLFSALRYVVTYIKLYEYTTNKT